MFSGKQVGVFLIYSEKCNKPDLENLKWEKDLYPYQKYVSQVNKCSGIWSNFLR